MKHGNSTWAGAEKSVPAFFRLLTYATVAEAGHLPAAWARNASSGDYWGSSVLIFDLFCYYIIL